MSSHKTTNHIDYVIYKTIGLLKVTVEVFDKYTRLSQTSNFQRKLLDSRGDLIDFRVTPVRYSSCFQRPAKLH